MSKGIRVFLTIFMLVSSPIQSVHAAELEASATDFASIDQLIRQFAVGVDTQDGDLINETFYAEGLVYGFAGDGTSIITLDVEQFAELHEQKRFGGQAREVSVDGLSITDGLLASASVYAVNKDVFYNYRMTFIKTDEVWKILNVTQRSRSN